MTAISLTTNNMLDNEELLNVQAQAEKTEKLWASAANGNFSVTAAGASLIDAQHVKDAAAAVVAGLYDKIITGRAAGKLPKYVRDVLRGLLNGADADANAAFAANLVKKSMDCFIDVAVMGHGEDVCEFNGVPVTEEQNWANVIHSIGKMLELEVRLQYLKVQAPQLFYHAGHFLKDPVYGDAYASLAAEAAMGGHDVKQIIETWKADKAGFVMPAPTADAPQWTPWVNAPGFLPNIAGFISNCINSTVPEGKQLWQRHMHTFSLKSTNYLVLTDYGHEQVIAAIGKEVSLTRCKEPMTDVPAMWSDETPFGGYHMNSISHADSFIRGANPGAKASQTVYDAVNALQSVGYVINEFTLALAEQLKDAGVTELDKFMPKVTGLNRKHVRKTVRTEMALAAAHKYSGSVFYTPWNVDYRGRMYPISSVLHVQSTDFEKSLLKVAEPQPIVDGTAWFLLIHIANCWDVKVDGVSLSKLSLDGRVDYVFENLKTVTAVATAPMDNMDVVTQADKPWQFMAACEEYNALFIDKSRTETSLLVALDCTCSGIQVLSGIIKDADAASLVNVSPSDAPQDAYQAIADSAAQLMLGNVKAPKNVVQKVTGFDGYVSLLTRKLCKKVVMTLPYNAAARSHSDYIREVLRDSGAVLPEDKDVRNALISALGISIRFAMKAMLPKVIELQKWLNNAAKAKAEACQVSASQSITWQTPSGFTVSQLKNEAEVVRLDTSFMGEKGRLEIWIADTDTVLPSKHGTCTMPNLIHSLDASLLTCAYAGYQKPFGLIHDSVMTTASDMQDAVDLFKQSYITHFGAGQIWELIRDVFATSPELQASMPVMGELNVEEVQNSMYLLS